MEVQPHWLFCLVVASVTALVYLLPQKYDAMSSLLVESNRAPVMRLTRH
jgi:hypothetical protein